MSSAPGTTPLTDAEIDRLKVPELRALCLGRGLSDDERRPALVKRLKQSMNLERREQSRQANLPPTPENLGPRECPAIIMGSAEIGGDEEKIESARKSLKTVLEEDELLVNHDVPQLAVGNRRGLGCAGLPNRVWVLESKVAALENRASIRNNTIASLQGQVNDLTRTADSQRAVRHRFLVFYKRDKVPELKLDDFDHKCMDEGNSIAHGGDAKADAELYRGFKARMDFGIYKGLYGYQPDIVWRIDHTPTLALLNLHATIKADIRRVASQTFYAYFAEFVDHFEASNFNPTYLDDGNNTLVTKAYWQFHECVEDEVKCVPKP